MSERMPLPCNCKFPLIATPSHSAFLFSMCLISVCENIGKFIFYIAEGQRLKNCQNVESCTSWERECISVLDSADIDRISEWRIPGKSTMGGDKRCEQVTDWARTRRTCSNHEGIRGIGSISRDPGARFPRENIVLKIVLRIILKIVLRFHTLGNLGKIRTMNSTFQLLSATHFILCPWINSSDYFGF